METPEDKSDEFIPGLDPEAYFDWRASEIGAITERLERRLILRLLGQVSGRNLLDLGCGDGKLAVELAARGARVTAVDASETMVEAAKTRAREAGVDIRFHVAKADSLPFRGDSFDIVSAVTILCFVEDASPVFDEIARILRPDDRLVIGELGKWSTWAAMRRIRGWLGSAMWRQGRFRTPGQLRTLAAESGLTPGPVCGAVYYPRWNWAARLMAPWDERIGRATTAGAAFMAFAAIKG